MTIPVAFRLVGEQEANPHAIALLKQFLGDRLGRKGFPCTWARKVTGPCGGKTADTRSSEGYYPSITDKAIMLAGNDERERIMPCVLSCSCSTRGIYRLLDSGLPGRTFPGRGRGILRYALEPRGPFEATAFLRGE
ncbi:MAG: hypothetical protein ACLU4J_17995 [Butyricimonas paravirosa]